MPKRTRLAAAAREILEKCTPSAQRKTREQLLAEARTLVASGSLSPSTRHARWLQIIEALPDGQPDAFRRELVATGVLTPEEAEDLEIPQQIAAIHDDVDDNGLLLPPE